MCVCENCGNEHDGSYGSGRFCSKECRGAFTAKMPRKHRYKEPYECEFCHEFINGRNALIRHKKKFHSDVYRSVWNKGLTKETDTRMYKISESLKRGIQTGKWILYQTGRPLTEEHKHKISESMKKAHKEGRAHNIGTCRWNCEPSWPERWFMQVVENEFKDKSYKREVPFYKFSLDFVWEHKRRVIEIDGEQHRRDKAQMRRDREKDALLANDGWSLLRLDWSWTCRNSKEAILIAKEFIDSE